LGGEIQSADSRFRASPFRRCRSGLRLERAQWFQASTEHFLLFTDTTEVKAQRLLTDLEARYTASPSLRQIAPAAFPIEVFLSRLARISSSRPRRVSVNGVVPPEKNAYLIKGPDRLFVIAKDKSPEDIAEDVGHALAMRGLTTR
jgi:hypothetical protein